MTSILSRREFLKIGSLSLGAFGFGPFFPKSPEDSFEDRNLGRVSVAQVSLYSQPRDDSRIIRQHFRDDLLHIYYALTPPTGPSWNPTWYRVWGGYVHSAHIQRVKIRHNLVNENLRAEGQLGELTVPFSQSMRYSGGWSPLYRLYYQTNHWVTDLDVGPDGEPWYELTDELGNTKFFVPANHIRLISDNELSPLSPNIPFEGKTVRVDLNRQTLTAFEFDQPVFHTQVSSGVTSQTPEGELPTETPTGQFNITNKMPSKHMGEGRLTDNLEDYELVGVPWTSFFDVRGYAIHGAYWHNNFGVRMSRGCINMRYHEAKWLFRWMTPINEPSEIDRPGYGTIVNIIKN